MALKSRAVKNAAATLELLADRLACSCFGRGKGNDANEEAKAYVIVGKALFDLEELGRKKKKAKK